MSEMKSPTRCRAFHTSVDLSAEQAGRIGDATGRQQAEDVCDQWVETPHLMSPHEERHFNAY
jgi:hypothetical protein